jgi:hypothetical protein
MSEFEIKGDPTQVTVFYLEDGRATGFHGVAMATASMRKQQIGRENRYICAIKLTLEPIEKSEYILGPLLSLSVTVAHQANGWEKETFGTTYLYSNELYKQVNRDMGIVADLAWAISADDVSRLEKIRASQSDPVNAPLNIRIEAEGVSTLGKRDGSGSLIYKPCRINTQCPMRIAASDWVTLVKDVSILPVTVELPVRVLSQDPYWEEAVKALSDARDAFRKGDGGVALDRCYDVLDRILRIKVKKDKGGIYQRSDWEIFFKNTEDSTSGNPNFSRFKALVDLFHSVGQMANILGHHAGQTDPSKRQPMEQWEAEIFLQMEHLAVAYLARYVQDRGI